MTRTQKINEAIMLALGWTKKTLEPKEGCSQYPVGCEQGWCWVSPEGNEYEGNNLMIRNYLDQLNIVQNIFPSIVELSETGDWPELEEIVNNISASIVFPDSSGV